LINEPFPKQDEVLLVEDDVPLAEASSGSLIDQYVVDVVNDGESRLAAS